MDEAVGIAFSPRLEPYTAVRVYGSGHVVAYNYVANFHDGIDVWAYAHGVTLDFTRPGNLNQKLSA